MKKSILICLCLTGQIMMALPEGEGYVEPVKVKKETDLQKQNREAREKAERRAQKALDEEEKLKRARDAELELKRDKATQQTDKKTATEEPTSVAAEPVRTQAKGVRLDLSKSKKSIQEEQVVITDPVSISKNEFVSVPDADVRDRKLGGRSPFERLTSRDIPKAKLLWEQARDSKVTTEEFIEPLIKQYDNLDLHARAEFEKNLKEVSNHLYKTFVESDKIENKFAPKQQARTDQPYFDWLEEDPTRLLSAKAHQETPLETAIRESSSEMTEKIFELVEKINKKAAKVEKYNEKAKQLNKEIEEYNATTKDEKMDPMTLKKAIRPITTIELLEPLINNFKKILNPKPGVRDEESAKAYVMKVNDILKNNPTALEEFKKSYKKIKSQP